mmetsp:Transcript_10631/g.26019  ORF Transcript_10631/g.26019 Transcript_10631/m.26019 type:complete len:401 (+) Transcript_10631:202-1404(+)
MLLPDQKSTEEEETKLAIEKKQIFLSLISFLMMEGDKMKRKREAVLVDPEVLDASIKVVENNLFQPLPPQVYNKMIDPEEDEEVFVGNWDNLHVAYEFLLRFLRATEWLEKKQALKKYITLPFVIRFLERFDSEDAREREYCRMILIRIYAKMMRLRTPIRGRFAMIFHQFIETECFNGITGLLEVLGGIITGFALPIKVEHKNFLKQVLMPMYKVSCLGLIFQPLSYCICQFVEKDPQLAVPVVTKMLKYWPNRESKKELLFLQELEDVWELTRPKEFEILLKPICKQIARGLSSPHFQIAQRTLLFWQNEYIANMLASYKEQVLPIILPALRDAQSHWNTQVSVLAENVLSIFADLEASLVKQVMDRYDKERSDSSESSKSEQRVDRWKKVYNTINSS